MNKKDQTEFTYGLCLYILLKLVSIFRIVSISSPLYDESDYFDATNLVSNSYERNRDDQSNNGPAVQIFDDVVSQSRNERPEMKIAIFYNIFVHPDRLDYQKTSKRIIMEQLKYRREEPQLKNSTIYYSHFGKQDFKIPDCSPCEKVGGALKGGEQTTLQKLHEYCVANPMDRVLYMHTKGSYTRCKKNHLLRNFLMKGIFSKECYDMPTDGTCDVCSSHFSTFPFHSVPGNMFVAECDYVRKLIPPVDFSKAKQAVMEKVWSVTDKLQNETLRQNKKNKKMFGTIYRLKSRERKQMRKGRRDWQIHREPWVGVGRYAMEHWIHSHPDARPCDVFEEEFQYKQKGDVIIKNGAKRVNAPRIANLTDMNYANHAWYRLPGRLFEYQEIYGSVPSPHTWIYKAYNDTDRQHVPVPKNEKEI